MNKLSLTIINTFVLCIPMSLSDQSALLLFLLLLLLLLSFQVNYSNSLVFIKNVVMQSFQSLYK